jgi:hypothetical protein
MYSIECLLRNNHSVGRKSDTGMLYEDTDWARDIELGLGRLVSRLALPVILHL